MEFGKRFKKKLLCVLVATSLVLTGCSGGEPTDDGEDDVPKGQYELVVMNQYGEIVPGAEVSIGGSTYTTSDYGTIKIANPGTGNYDISVKCNNYYDYNAKYSIGDESTGKITIKAATLDAHRLQSAVYKRGAGKVDLVDTYQKVNKGTAGWKFSIDAAVCNDAETVASYKLFQRTESGDKEIASSTTGEFNDISINDFSVGTGVFITVYDNDGNQISTSLRLEIAENPNYTEHTELSFGNENKITVSDKVPIFGGTELNFGFPSIPLDYKVSEDTIHIGFNVDDETFDDNALFENYKKMLNQVKAAKFASTNMKTAIAQLKKKQKKKGVMGMAGFDKGVEVTASGYAEAGVNSDGTLSSGTGYLCVTAEASAEFDWQFVVWVIPVTIGITGAIEADFADTITYDFNENKLEGDSSLTLKPSLEANAGVGFKYLNGGVYGSAGLETKLVIASLSEEPGFTYLDLSSSIGIYARVAWFEPKYDIAKGTFHLWTREDKKSAQSVKKISDGMTDFSQLYDLTNYKLSKNADKIKIKAVSKGDKTVIASRVNPAAEPVVSSNGTDALNVYTVRENVNGTDYTAPKLYYQTYTADGNTGSWSDAKKVDQDESDSSTAVSEMNQKLYTDGKDYYMVYQESSVGPEILKSYASASTDAEKDSILKSIWKNVELHVKKYDTENNKWIDYGKIKTDAAFDYNADIIVNEGQIYVCSAANAEGDYFGTGTDKNYINISNCTINDALVTKNWNVKKAAGNLNSVTSLAAGIKDNKITCVYGVDSDNDFSTDEQEIKSYTDGDSQENISVCTGSAVTVDYGYKNDGKETFTIASNSKLSYLKDDGTVNGIVDDMGSYDGVYAITDRGIYYAKNTENGTEIFVRYKTADGTYGDAVQVTQEERWLRNVSAFTIADKDFIVASSDDYDVEGDRGVTDSEIDAFEVTDYYDLNVEEASYDLNNSLMGEELPVTLKLKNDGNKKISYVEVKVNDADGKEVAQKSKYYAADIEPGNEKNITLELSGMNIAEYGDWKVSADIVSSMPEDTANSGDNLVSMEPAQTEEASTSPNINNEPKEIEEKTKDNNGTEMALGNSDFVVRTQMCDSGAYPYMLVEVKNEGNRKDSAALKLYNANDVTESYGERDVSNLEPGSAKMFKVNIKQDWADDNGKVAVLAHVQDASNEMYTYNNYAYQYTTINYGRFLINYILNGGVNNSENPSTYTTADRIKLKEPTKDGYTFEGWYTSSKFDIISRISEIASGNAQDISVYAKWKQKEAEAAKTPAPEATEKPLVKPTTTPTKTPAATAKATAKPTTKPTTKPGSNNPSAGSKVKLLKKGIVKKLTKYNAYFKVTKPGKVVKNKITGGEVQFVKPIKNKTSISVPDTVKIGKFSYKVKSVAGNALKNKKTLKKVTIGKNVTTIGKNAFTGSKKLKNITVKSSVLKSVGKNVFKGIYKKAVIKVPKSKYKKYKKLFNKKTGFGRKMKLKK